MLALSVSPFSTRLLYLDGINLFFQIISLYYLWGEKTNSDVANSTTGMAPH